MSTRAKAYVVGDSTKPICTTYQTVTPTYSVLSPDSTLSPQCTRECIVHTPNKILDLVDLSGTKSQELDLASTRADACTDRRDRTPVGGRSSGPASPHQPGEGSNREGESGDPNPDICKPGWISLVEMSSKAGVALSWLKIQVRNGIIPGEKVEAPGTKYGFKWTVDRRLVDRIRLLYLRRRRMTANSSRGITRNGTYYRHDGSIAS